MAVITLCQGFEPDLDLVQESFNCFPIGLQLLGYHAYMPQSNRVCLLEDMLILFVSVNTLNEKNIDNNLL